MSSGHNLVYLCRNVTRVFVGTTKSGEEEVPEVSDKYISSLQTRTIYVTGLAARAKDITNPNYDHQAVMVRTLKSAVFCILYCI